jgi:L-alanine-DL-glutamate epimerase-like enolase superfamily enzyme
MRRDIQPKDEAERLRRLHAEHGFQAFKIRVGKVTGHDEDEWPGRTEAIIPAVRKAVGDKVILQADANSCYSPAKAIEVGRMMQNHGYFFFEEPCPFWELEWTAEVNQALDMHVAGGEQDNDLAQWRRMIAMDAVEITQPDICYIGGVSRAMQVAKMAEASGKMCVPHSANLSLLTVFAQHLMAAIPNAAPHLEYSIEPTPWAEEIYTPLPRVQDGKLPLPDGPGWGIAIRQDWLKKAEREVSEQA